jgi:YVTN family beta-propeller protein
MTRNIKAFATALAVSLAAASLAEAATVYIPEGSAGEVAIVDTTKDAIVGRITDVPMSTASAARPRGAIWWRAAMTRHPPRGARRSPSRRASQMTSTLPITARQPGRQTGAVSILTIIDVADGSPVRRLEVPGAVHHVAVSPDGRFAVATHPNADGISVIDLEELSVGELVRTGPLPNYAAFSADGTRLYISNAGNDTVSEIDTERWFVTRNMLAGETPEHLVLSPDGRTLFVADVVAGIVQELDIEAGAISRSFEIGGELHGLDVSEDAATLFVSGNGEDKLVAIDLKSGAMRSAPLAPAPYHLAVVPGTGKLYVSSRDEPKVWVVDQASLAPQGTITIRGEGHQMVVLP